jgi:dTDP-4-dehydrorhamnose reductase
VLNAGANTAVDKAESVPELALAGNAGAPMAFAEALRDTGGRLLQLSIDFVFNGQQGSPYRPEKPRDPLGVYGQGLLEVISRSLLPSWALATPAA